MKAFITVRPRHAILLADLVLYVLALKDRRPEIVDKVKSAIREGRFYEQN